MNYIVLDLEWNQPMSYSSPAYKSVGESLLFELIQIGAIKMNGSLEITDSFTQLIKPVHYARLHPRIKRITHITQEQVDDAPGFAEALERFAAFCGEDYALLTWGCDDVSVLEQNKRFFKCDVRLADMYDMQRVYGELIGNLKERQGLQSAMTHFEIDPDEEKPFHNALNDAYYTALVFQKFPVPSKVLQYPLKPRLLQHTPKKQALETQLRARGSLSAMLNGSACMLPPCPVCGKKLTVPEGYVRRGENKFAALADCPHHGLVISTVERRADPNGKFQYFRTTALSEEQSKAYISTKHLQWKNKVALEKANAAKGGTP